MPKHRTDFDHCMRYTFYPIEVAHKWRKYNTGVIPWGWNSIKQSMDAEGIERFWIEFVAVSSTPSGSHTRNVTKQSFGMQFSEIVT